ncbi:Hypothetical predicted protein [Mytilus galloprovincialis]|uniref:Exonuclease domain-containing protein n=1 Tax=Mytilus galloprovincialis TaxID=29158 RepID=A0A8B6DBL7_MYTGA|nr:Hypothetical predicted protein [Mytilus galloprovincialis]
MDPCWTPALSCNHSELEPVNNYPLDSISSICSHPKQLKLKLSTLHVNDEIQNAENRLKENCHNLNLSFRKETSRDGNCLFEAVASQLSDLGIKEMSAQEMRQEVIEYLMENRDFEGVDGHIRKTKETDNRPVLEGKEHSGPFMILVNFENIEIDHNYGVGHLCIAGATGCAVCCPGIDKLLGSTKINTSTSWHSGRRLVEWGTLLDHLKFCSRCYNGPLILSHETIKGEMKCGLGGYLYIQCTSCQELNRVPYGSTHKENPSSKGMPSFCVNTKLGAAMIDSLGGPQRVNNVLTTLNLPSISHKNLKVMERRAGDMIEDFANMSMERRGREAFAAEMRDSNLVEDVTLVPPNVQNTQLISTGHEELSENTCSYPEMIDVIAVSQSETRDANLVIDSGEFVIPNSNTQTNTDGNSVEILDRNPFGMTVCADHGWQKRGFDSLTVSHTFLMTKLWRPQLLKNMKATQLDKKLRRLQLKEERMTSKGACEASEGATYDSEISLGDKDADIHQIPNATPKPTFSKVEGLINTTTSFIIMDLETTDLIRQNVIPHITQIAAVEHDTGSQFSCYVVPKAPMSSGAEDITGIMWDGTNLRLNGKVVAALPIFEALSNFFLWLQKFNNAILIAHNGKKFDFRILSNAADKCKLFNLYLESCVGCIDSIAVMKSKIPKLPKYSQPYLAEHVCNKNYNAHNALDDVSMLNEILKAAKVSSVDLLKHTYSPGDHLLQENFNMNKLKNLPSLHFLIGQGVVKMTTAENISGSGLNFEHLKLIWKREDVDIGKQKTVLRKKGSLAKRRKPSRTSVHSMGAADENSRYSDSTEPKPVMQNGHTDEDVFSRNSSSSVDSDAQSPPAKKPLAGMVALPGMGMPMGLPKRKSRGSTPSDSDLTPDEAKKDFRNIGVKLPIPSSRGSSESDNQSNITSPKLRKTSDKEVMKSPVEPTHQFEKPKLKAVSRPVREREESDDSKMFDMPALKQVEKSPTKSRAFEQNDDMDTKHVFQTPKLRKVDDAPTESLRFIHGKTGEDDETESRISDDSRHIFQTPTLKKVDNPPTKTLRNLHGDESDMKLTLGDHMGESSTDDIDIGMYFEKPQLRNVPKPTETLRNVYKEKPQIDVPELKNVPKMELELKSPTEIDNKFNVPQLKSVQKERETDNQEKEEGTFQIPTLRSTPLPKRREPPKSPETKTFDVPMLRRTPRVKSETDTVESEKPPTGIFEKPKLKSARSLQQDMDDSTNKDSHSKHRFDVPSLRNTPSKKESSVQRSESVRSDHEKPSWLQDTKLKPTRGGSIDSSGDKDTDKPSWLTSDSRKRHDSKENKNVDSFDLSESTPRKSSIPLQETKPENGINGHHTPSRTRLTSASSEHDDDEIKTKKNTGRDQYVPSWLKTTDTKGKSPSTPNLAFVTPTKDSSEVPQWKRELAEKRRRQKDGDGAPTPMKAEPAGDKGLPPWKVELGQMKMRQTPAKVSAHETKKSTEPEWKKAADEKRQRLRSIGDSCYDDEAVDHVAPGQE